MLVAAVILHETLMQDSRVRAVPADDEGKTAAVALAPQIALVHDRKNVGRGLRSVSFRHIEKPELDLQIHHGLDGDEHVAGAVGLAAPGDDAGGLEDAAAMRARRHGWYTLPHGHR